MSLRLGNQKSRGRVRHARGFLSIEEGLSIPGSYTLSLQNNFSSREKHLWHERIVGRFFHDRLPIDTLLGPIAGNVEQVLLSHYSTGTLHSKKPLTPSKPGLVHLPVDPQIMHTR
jgi:hypothetical protein